MVISGLTTKDDFEKMFAPGEMDSYGDRWGHRWRGSQKLRYQITLDLLFEEVEKKPNLKILEIGCGQGDLLLQLYSSFPDGIFFGTDISDNVIAWNKTKYNFCQFKQAALPDVPFHPNSFDLICACEVLCYLDEPQQRTAFINISRALKPDGLFLFSGVLDEKKGYFGEEKILKSVNEFFAIELIAYNYGKLYNFIELPLLNLFRLTVKFDEINLWSPMIYQQWVQKQNKYKQLIFFVLKSNLILPFVNIFNKMVMRVLKALLKSVWLPKLFFHLSKATIKKRWKSHIIILAKNVQ
jgi:ubiquinone/menaquinone biosynthesis C-methylase UbiE